MRLTWNPHQLKLPGFWEGQRPVSPSRFVRLLIIVLAAIPLPAAALDWHWSFRRPADADGGAVFATGMLITTDSPDASGFYTINSVIGERNAVPISTLLPAGSVAPGNCYAVNNCFASDNLLRTLEGGGAQLTSHGFNVGFVDGSYANYFFANFLSPPAYLEFFSVPPFDFIPPTGPQPPDSELKGEFKAIPVPGPLPLAGALIGLGWTRRLRRNKRR